MKKIELPVTNTVSFTLSPSDAAYTGILMPDGLQHISMGEIKEIDWENLKIARENGGKILWSTVCLEKSMEDILLSYFMGAFSGACDKRELFKNELLQASFFQLSAKKHLVSKVATKYYLFKGKEREKLEGHLKSIIQWRNAFAHGSLTLNATAGVVLNYYSGSPKEDVLSDTFWNTVESVFKNCDDLLKKLSTIIKEHKPRK